MESVAETYGSYVFDDKVMRRRLPKETYDALKATIRVGRDIDINIANVVANAMKDWAVENGATHYTHWFQPMTGATAEKHESFVNPVKDGSAIMEFSGKELIKGEPDASSFPSGGLRATFEARGYTAWDPTSFAFLKEGTLCIPTAFCSYSGETLDKKTPLLKSMEALSEQAVRILKLFGNNTVKRVNASVGLEQEYFLLDKKVASQRKDLLYCGRTLLGARPPKGQELEDHYFGAIKPRVASFMRQLDEELWKFGIPAKTEHNEAAPSQHELASVYSTVNLSVDRNQLVMEEMRKVADKNGLTCLLHEKPFAGVNGSGKHNNWSMTTDTGVNLLEPGDSPVENAQFLLMLTAVIKAVDEYQDLLRTTVASSSNDCRLGADEAPPAIVSMFLGDELTEILESIANGSIAQGRDKEQMVLGVHVLPDFPKDSTDRNRTSPFAFTGNKFEFRMPGSSQNASGPNIVINTAVAKSLDEFATILEKAKDFDAALTELVKKEYSAHRRIVFNGNNYSAQWYEEAAKRGLCNMKTTADAANALVASKNVDMFAKYGIFTFVELESRKEIVLENYNKTVSIEALTMLEIVRKEIIPAVVSYIGFLGTVKNCSPLKALEEHLTKLLESLFNRASEIDDAMVVVRALKSSEEQAGFYSSTILPLMQNLRAVTDEIEPLTGKDYWPFPTYGDLLFSV